MKLNPPVAKCTKCGKLSWRAESINQRCSEWAGKKRCQGVFRSRINDGDWEECPDCNAKGRINEVRCRRCDGVGWEDTRHYCIDRRILWALKRSIMIATA